MTNDQLQAIEDMLSRATPGPWEAGRYPEDPGLIHRVGMIGPVAVARFPDSMTQRHLDACFIANAPTDIAALIKALKEARAEVVELKAELADIDKWNRLGRE